MAEGRPRDRSARYTDDHCRIRIAHAPRSAGGRGGHHPDALPVLRVPVRHAVDDDRGRGVEPAPRPDVRADADFPGQPRADVHQGLHVGRAARSPGARRGAAAARARRAGSRPCRGTRRSTSSPSGCSRSATRTARRRWRRSAAARSPTRRRTCSASSRASRCGSPNIDYNGRYCMASAAAGQNRAFGIDRGLPFPVERHRANARRSCSGARTAPTRCRRSCSGCSSRASAAAS